MRSRHQGGTVVQRPDDALQNLALPEAQRPARARFSIHASASVPTISMSTPGQRDLGAQYQIRARV